MEKVRTRFAPSPTGLLHAGNYRSAIFAYLYAKHAGGDFIVRIEDTDKARSKKEYEDNIYEALKWLELPADETYRQSENLQRHRFFLQKLIENDLAYISKEIPKKPGDRDEVIRFRNPKERVSFTDLVRGEIIMDTADLGDFIIARTFDEPVFHFAVVIDDADENITHVIRGEDHISNTPRQILIQRALGFKTPLYAHLPLILGPDRMKLSKRRGAKALTEYRDLGFLPEALLNYLAFLGWNPGDDKEYLSIQELIEAFDLARVQKGSAIFDETKLLSVNQYWMRKLPDEKYIENLQWLPNNPEQKKILIKTAPLLKERARTFKEAHDLLSGELSCLFKAPVLEREKLLAKEPADRMVAKEALEALILLIRALPALNTAMSVKEALMPFADAEEAKGKGGRGAVLWPLRYALSGAEKSPDPFILISILGPEESASRIHHAIGILGK